ncbi:TIGR03087 family PEP-CTERM/XrtA system glycosyltransferase [Paraglaciecola aquimarina]|uniref:TIGR03087 family PEP-CTERM/XrtA system glycosyltransferase n=1 Tax=Paraglaciecola algarum TaxID=3050085 RepID=A0ABS9D7X6_9ALTE|nr:TIGR03087 family PEP-CTERM/XrtA system glycosyltransferase [Paraglaciecola sp. G1-23]MCF2947771.1 TIGR03087 family PEP-CTERM/XrtA system glycosyltransferase [Paraglaciecola sp. G1-23]
MHILILAQRVPFPPNKGEKLRTFHQLEYLKRNGFKISLLAPHETEDELKYFAELEEKYCERVITHKLKPKYLSLPMGLLTNKPLSVANFYHPKLQSQFDKLIEDVSFDAIMCSASSLAEYIFKSKVVSNLKEQPRFIMDFMDLDSDKWAQYASKSGFPMSFVYQRENKLMGRFERRIVDIFDACFFISQAEIDLFNQNSSKSKSSNIHVIENGLDRTMFFPPAKARQTEQPVFLFAGVMNYPPNIDAVMWFVKNVWQEVLSNWPNAKFYIAGMNPSDKIQQLAELQGIQVTGFVDDIKPYFDQANIFVAPFRIARGVQNKVLQAFACGLPVIATSMGAEGVRYNAGQDILLADTPDEFIKQISLLLSDHDLYNRLNINAIENIKENYSWDSLLAPFKEHIAPSIPK